MRRPETPPNWMRPFLQPENPTDIPSARSVQPSVLAHSPFGFLDRKSTRLNSSHSQISYAVFCLKKKKLLYNTSGGKAVKIRLPPKLPLRLKISNSPTVITPYYALSACLHPTLTLHCCPTTDTS